MTLQDFLRTLRHGWWVVVACLVIGGLGGVAVAQLQTPQYSAGSTLFIATTGTSTGAQVPEARQTDNQFVQSRATTYAGLATTSTVLQSAADILQGTSLTELQQDITSGARESTNLIDITSTAPSAARAADEANAVAQALASTVNALEAAGTSSESQVVLRVVQQASPPTAPVSPRLARTVLVGLIVGLASGVAATVLVQVLSGRLRSPRDVAAVAGLVPTSIPEKRAGRGKGASPERRREAYRSLRSNLRHGIGARGSVAVAPVMAGASARPLAEELARAFGEVGTRVLLIDADLRDQSRTSRHRSRPAEQAISPGLADVLTGRCDLHDAVVPGEGANLWRLPVGGFTESTSQLLSGEAMTHLMDVAVRDYDFVLVVSPPMLERSEAAVLAAQAHACVLVMAARVTRRSDLLFALERVFAVGVTSVSLVLDNVARHDMQPARVRYDSADVLPGGDAESSFLRTDRSQLVPD